MSSRDFPLPLLQTAEQVQLLNDIDKLRSDGVQYHHVSLPQLVVCGDQSSGKSSVLEALSNVNFPVGTGTRTRFPMELALRRSPEKKATAKIIPGRCTSVGHRRQLADFKPSHVDLASVPQMIEEARETMGLTEGHAICDYALRLEVTGPDLPHLTLVDLPGLIADAKETEDIKLVEDMVKKYMKNTRSIILAIVSAQNDNQNQKVLRLARESDPYGDRTVGIITKPDTLKNYRGSIAERTYLDTAKNQITGSKLRLGWHVVRNLDYHERQKDSTCNRGEKEKELFSQEPWNELSTWQLGIEALRDQLTKHLFNQICAELPRVVEDIEREEAKCQQELKDLGEARQSSKEQRKYLIGISGRIEQLVAAGLEGHWTMDPVFNDENMRLRAKIRNLNDEFEMDMKTLGHTFEFKPANYERLPHSFSFGGYNPGLASRADVLGKVNKILKSGRGRELPGMFDPILVSDVFRDQSRNWQSLARRHVDKVWRVTCKFLEALFCKVTPAKTNTAEAILDVIVLGEMLSRKRALDAKIEELLLPYVRNLPFCTSSRMAASLEAIDLDSTKDEQVRGPKEQRLNLVDSEIDIDACSMLLRYSQAYYNIARDTFVDNVVTLAIENCLLAGIASIFSSDMILDMEDSKLARLAGESEKTLSDRKYAEQKSQLLKRSLETCRIHMPRRLILSEDYQRGLVQGSAGLYTSSPVPPPGTGLFGAPAVTSSQALIPQHSMHNGKHGNPPLFGRFAKPAPGSGTNYLGMSAAADKSNSGISLSQTSTSVNAPAISIGLFSDATAARVEGFGLPHQTDTSASVTQKASSNRPESSASLSPNPAFKDHARGRRSLSAGQETPSAARAVTPTSQGRPSRPRSVSATAKQGRLAPGLRLPTDNEVPDGMEKRVTDICNRLSNFVDGAKEIDGDGTALCYKSKSFEELHLEDWQILQHPDVRRLVQKYKPEVSKEKLTQLEVENWCREYMATH